MDRCGRANATHPDARAAQQVGGTVELARRTAVNSAALGRAFGWGSELS